MGVVLGAVIKGTRDLQPDPQKKVEPRSGLQYSYGLDDGAPRVAPHKAPIWLHSPQWALQQHPRNAEAEPQECYFVDPLSVWAAEASGETGMAASEEAEFET